MIQVLHLMCFFKSVLDYHSSVYAQGSAHTGEWWSGPSTTQKILSPLSFETAFFYHHLIFKIVFLPRFGLKNVQTDQILTTTQSSLGRTLYVRYASIVVLRAHWLPRYTHAAQLTIMHTTHQNASESEFPHILHQWASLGRAWQWQH